MEVRRMLAGANHYYQGTDILKMVGSELSNAKIKKILVLCGYHAMEATWCSIKESLDTEEICYCIELYSGFTTSDDIEHYCEKYRLYNCEAVLGIGGGKIMDLAKAVSAVVKCPVYNVATSVATCACFAPLSIVYNENGQQVQSRFHDNEVNGVFVDLNVIAKAPARLLAAGMADAMAKACEYSSTHSSLKYGEIDTAKYLGYCLAKSADEVLLSCGAQAYRDVCAGKVTQELEDAVFTSVAVIGVVSGMCGYTSKPGGRFAIAHGFNEVIRGRWEKDPTKFLHGEIVAVGILAQLYVNKADETYISRVREFFREIGVPTSLSDLGLCLQGDHLSRFEDEIIANTAIGVTHEILIRRAIEKVA